MTKPTIEHRPAWTPGTNTAPDTAFRFDAGPFQFAAVEDGAEVLPFRMTARSGDAIYHWYWGRIIHDMTGMILRKPSVTVDYAHDLDDVLGYANKFSATPDGLEVEGALVSIGPDDKAREIYLKGKAGVPYESSIDWEGPESELEYIPEGVSTEVNGRQFEGPGFVVRKWPLRGIAVCRWGADAATHTQFSATDSAGVRQFTLREFQEMTKPEMTAPAAGASQDTGAGVPAGNNGAANPGLISIDTLRQFSAEFGDKATEFLTAGLSLDAARYQFMTHKNEQLTAQLSAAAAETETLKKQLSDTETKLKQLSAAGLGAENPLGEPDGKPAPARQFATDNRATIAAGMKLRGQA